jgi:dTDP-4-amino-4,6-dideoxygalactose transaminase
MFGRAADLESLLGLGLPVIEDCAMCIGAERGGKKLGSHGALGVFSFYATKVLCAGEGGAVVTSDRNLADRIRDLREYDGRSDPGPRFNYKLTDLQAAVARAQLQKLHDFLDRRRALGLLYTRELEDTEARLPQFGSGDYPFRYVVAHPRGAEELIPHFEAAGVAARKPAFCPLHRHLGHLDRDYPATSTVFTDAIALPLYPSLSEDEVGRVLAAAREVL